MVNPPALEGHLRENTNCLLCCCRVVCCADFCLCRCNLRYGLNRHSDFPKLGSLGCLLRYCRNRPFHGWRQLRMAVGPTTQKLKAPNGLSGMAGAPPRRHLGRGVTAVLAAHRCRCGGLHPQRPVPLHTSATPSRSVRCLWTRPAWLWASSSTRCTAVPMNCGSVSFCFLL